MDEGLVKDALCKLVDDNKAGLVGGLSVGGEDLAIRQISPSILTPAELPISIGVHSPRNTEFYDAVIMGGNTLRQSQQSKNKKVHYDIELHISDQARYASGEGPGEDSEKFVTHNRAFDTFVARTVQLLRDNAYISPLSGSWKIEVLGYGGSEDRRIERDNWHQWTEDANGVRSAIFYSVLKFTIETCQEPSPTA